jgi:GT2 family glycosyltransferase
VTTLVSIGLVTWNSADEVAACVESIRQQTHPSIELLAVDNASADDTRAALARCTAARERRLLDRNVGFSAAHNLAIAATRGTYYLTLNPDVRLEPGFVGALVAVMESMTQCGSASGKLRRPDPPPCIDSTGVYLLPTQRHLDRGAGEHDRGQYDHRELVFGVTGAAGFYRRAMLLDVAVDGEVFDESFFAYREDVDLAWRAQLRGWACVYEPGAVATHARRVTPERRQDLPASINRMSVRNRFLLRIKNQTLSQTIRYAVPTACRDLQVIGYSLLREHSSLPGLVEVVALLPATLRKRRTIMRRRRAPVEDLNRWFRERSRPA